MCWGPAEGTEQMTGERPELMLTQLGQGPGAVMPAEAPVAALPSDGDTPSLPGPMGHSQLCARTTGPDAAHLKRCQTLCSRWPLSTRQPRMSSWRWDQHPPICLTVSIPWDSRPPPWVGSPKARMLPSALFLPDNCPRHQGKRPEWSTSVAVSLDPGKSRASLSPRLQVFETGRCPHQL